MKATAVSEASVVKFRKSLPNRFNHGVSPAIPPGAPNKMEPAGSYPDTHLGKSGPGRRIVRYQITSKCQFCVYTDLPDRAQRPDG